MSVPYRLINLPPFMGVQHRFSMSLDLGCIVELTWQVRLRPIDAGFNAEDLDHEEAPVYVYWDEHRKAWYFVRTWAGTTRNVYIEPNHVSSKAARRTFQVPDSELTDEIVNARIGAYARVHGLKVHDPWWEKGKPSKAVRQAFREWVGHVMRGGNWDDSALWDDFYERLDYGPGNMLYKAVGWIAEHSPITSRDIFVLRARRHPEVAYEVVGIDLAAVDWCALSEAIAAEHAK
jgi:hypothetical protein